MLPVRESHPVERAHAGLLRLLDEVAVEIQHVRAVLLVSILGAGAPFTENHGGAFLCQQVLQVVDSRVQCAFRRREILDVGIAVHLENQVVHHLVVGQFHLLQRILQMTAPVALTTAGTVGVHYEVALGIVAARGAHGVDESLCIAVDAVIGRAGNRCIVVALSTKRSKAPGVFRVEHLVVTLKEQVLVVVAELFGNLLPQCLIAFALLLVVVLTGHEPRRVGGSRVVVHVQNAVHARIDDVVHHLLHAAHPGGVDLRAQIVLRRIPVAVVVAREPELRLHVRIPRHRHTDGIEPRLLEHLHQRSLRHRLAPRLLIVCGSTRRPVLYPHVQRVARIAVERVAEVPAHSHVLHGLMSCFKLLLLRQSGRRPQKRQKKNSQ